MIIILNILTSNINILPHCYLAVARQCEGKRCVRYPGSCTGEQFCGGELGTAIIASGHK